MHAFLAVANILVTETAHATCLLDERVIRGGLLSAIWSSFSNLHQLTLRRRDCTARTNIFDELTARGNIS